MFGLFAAYGPVSKQFTTERLRGLWIPGSKMKVSSDNDNFAMARFVPENHQDNPIFHASSGGVLHLALDGYVITESAQHIFGLQPQIDSLIDSFMKKGIRIGLQDLVAGSYVLTIVDPVRRKAYVITDPAGSVPVYFSKVENGWLVSTNSMALARTGDVDTTIDSTACAEWVLFAYAVGERYPVKGIRVLPPGTILTMDLDSGIAHRERYERFWETPQSKSSPPVESTDDAFQKACERLQVIDPRPAHLQSAGMDSRLIIASWPKGFDPTCYTYGDPNAHEIRIAHMIAKTRGSNWIHTWQHGDEVAANMDSIFYESGIIMWPDRRYVAEKISENGHNGVLDGLGGDVMLAGLYYGHNRYFKCNKKINRLFAISGDEKYSEVSMDHIVESIYDYILQIKDFDYLKNYIKNEYIISIINEKDNILQDIWNCIQFCKPETDSMALLWRNFLLATRAVHYVNQQGVVCKRFINVYCPFSNDNNFSRIAMGIHPEDSMYRRYYVRLYRKCHPRYADIPCGDTLIPLRRPAANHMLSKKLLSMNLSIPWLTGSPHGRVRDPNGWSIWLQESDKLREYARSCIASAGLLNQSRADVYFGEIASQKVRGGGKLFHLASVAKWMTISKSCN